MSRLRAVIFCGSQVCPSVGCRSNNNTDNQVPVPWSLPWHHLISSHRCSHLLSPALSKFINFSHLWKSEKVSDSFPTLITFLTVRANLSYVVNKVIVFRHEQEDNRFGAWDHYLSDILTAAEFLKQGAVRDCQKKQGLTFVSMVLTWELNPGEERPRGMCVLWLWCYTWLQETSLPPVNGWPLSDDLQKLGLGFPLACVKHKAKHKGWIQEAVNAF